MAARTYTEARKLKAALSADVARGDFRELSRISFAEHWQPWIEAYQGRRDGINEHTRSEYRVNLGRLRSTSGGCG